MLCLNSKRVVIPCLGEDLLGEVDLSSVLEFQNFQLHLSLHAVLVVLVALALLFLSFAFR